jgi:hypothetical protein
MTAMADHQLQEDLQEMDLQLNKHTLSINDIVKITANHVLDPSPRPQGNLRPNWELLQAYSSPLP